MKVSKKEVDERRKKVMKVIQNEQKANVIELAERFQVSTLTIRRDLQFWEEKGAIIRNYGGAYLIQEFVENDEYDRERYMRAIAKRAASYIVNNDVIFLNSSKTALMILEFIKHKKVTVFTNNAKAINYTPDSLVTVVFTGGEVRFPKNSMSGNVALVTLSTVFATKCFIGCSGLDETGVSTELMTETLINQTMLSRTRGEKFLLCDHYKFGLYFGFNYASFDTIDYLITDHEANREIIGAIKNRHDTEIIQVEPMMNLNAG